MVPTAMYRQERISTDTGRLPKFMAAPPGPHHWVAVLRGLVAQSPRLAGVTVRGLRGVPGLAAGRFQTHRMAMTPRSPNTPAISIPAPGGTVVSPALFPRCR